MEKKTIDLNDYKILKELGINILTGEACGVGMRLLCDVDENGQALLSEYLGGVEFIRDGWNNWKGKSVMLNRDIFPGLTIFAMLREYPVVVHLDNKKWQDSRLFCFDKMEDWNIIRDKHKYTFNNNFQVYYRSGTATGGLRNRHEFSGRVD